MVAIAQHQIGHAQRLLRAEVERHRFGCADVAAVHGVDVAIHALYPLVEETPYAGFAEAQCGKVCRSVGVGKGEIFVFSFEVALGTGKADDVLGVHYVLAVAQVKAVDAALVGMCRDAVVGDAYGYPNGTLAARSLAYHFHNPHLVRVGY